MNDATRSYINKITDAVRSAFDIAIPIDNIDNLVNELGGRIVVKPGLDPFYDGTVKKVGDTSFIIAIFPHQSSEGRSFAIAHELGHLFLHMGYLTSKETWHKYGKSGQCGQFTNFGTDEQEHQANAFAAALLMPQKVFKESIDTNGNFVDMAQVSNYFHVSIATATNYGRTLKYLQ